MAENIIETRIQLRYGTYTEWMSSSTILKVGEAAICAFPRVSIIDGLSNSHPENTPPAIGIKIGDGFHDFKDLPWVQAVAADVYEWAKSSYKPVYTAQEIQGLQAYIEGFVSGDVDVTIAPRIYQLVRGTDENINKYYLRYKENNEDSAWIIDTSIYIDLDDLVTLKEWIGNYNLENYRNLSTRIIDLINTYLSNLIVNDETAEGYFVSAVSQSNGIITVEKTKPKFTDLQGIASVTQGGTGKSSLNEGEVLVGNGAGAVKTIPIAESIDNNNYLVPNRVIKAYVDSSVAGLTGAMHFIGEAGVVITNNSSVDPRIGNYDFNKAQPGDVILYDSKEFVWGGNSWILLGDEGSYAIKGSIVDADINADAAIQQSKIANLAETFATKVNIEEGKSLTSNDFTNEYKTKLDNIEEDAQQNTIENIFLNGNRIPPTTVQQLEKSVNIQINEFDETSQQKLNGIEVGAQENKIEKIIYDGNEITPVEKTITIVSNPHTEHENKIESIFLNDVEWTPNKDKQVRIRLDQAALNLNVLEGAIIPGPNNTFQDVSQIQKKLMLAVIAATGNIKDILQESDTFVTINCGSSTDVI